ncbi:MAG: polysaccharide deacetylase family protein [Kofleriaceae bacterium]
MLGIAACKTDLADLDGMYYDGDGRAVHCAVNLDTSAKNELEDLDGALDRAAARGEVVELYGHKPGVTFPLSKLEYVLAGVQARGLAYVTYADFAAGGGTGPGIALSFDDSGINNWTDARPLFLQFGARVTFFVTRYALFDDLSRTLVRQLADDGHAIEAHSVKHLRAPLYVEEHGLDAYLADEALPSIELLRADGYPVTAYAYPFGSRTDELDHALLEHVPILRSVTFSMQGAVSPCPR